MKDFENKKILYVFEYFPPTIQGGAEISGELRARHLTKNNSVFILTPNYEKLKLEVITKHSYRLIKYPSLRSLLFRVRAQTSHKIIKKDQAVFSTLLLLFTMLSAIEMNFWIWWSSKKYGTFDILYGNNTEANIAVAKSHINARKVIHLRDDVFFRPQKIKNSLHRTAHQFLHNYFTKTLAKVGEFIAISKYLKRRYSVLLDIPPEKICIVHNRVADEMICSLTKQQAREKLNLNLTQKYILFVGTFTKKKGIDFLVNDVAPYLNCQFLLVGGGLLQEKIAKTKPNNVNLCGFIKPSEVKYYYKAADCLVVPSIAGEGWGRVSSEAQANGTFSIVNDDGGLPETIQEGKGIVIKNENLLKYLQSRYG